MAESNIVEFSGRDTITGPLTEPPREGSREFPQPAVVAELGVFMALDWKTPNGDARVVHKQHECKLRTSRTSPTASKAPTPSTATRRQLQIGPPLDHPQAPRTDIISSKFARGDSPGHDTDKVTGFDRLSQDFPEPSVAIACCIGQRR